MEEYILQVEDLCVGFFNRSGLAQAVDHVCLQVEKHKIIGIVGESGCGKSMTVRSILRLIKYPGRIISGSIRLEGKELTTLSDRDMAAVRGKEIAMIFQEPMTSLNPVMPVGRQVEEALRLHRHISRQQARAEVLKAFEKVGISEPQKRYRAYPHELSGGLRQRVMIAMAMVCQPKLLLADEPTTALDVTVEAQILRLMKQLCDETGMSMILISHNLGVIAQLCDYVYVMYAGRIVEQAETFELFRNPIHPYTQGLLNAVTALQRNDQYLDTIPGSVPDLTSLPSGCSFAPRCAYCTNACRSCLPELLRITPDHSVRCIRTKEKEIGT